MTVLKLAPGTHLRLHAGPKNLRLTLHLGLTVPLGPTIRVGTLPGEVREWEEGKVIAFDDSFVHEVRVRPLHPSSTLVRGIEMRLKNMRASCMFQGLFVCCFASGYYTQHGLSAAGVAQRD